MTDEPVDIAQRADPEAVHLRLLGGFTLAVGDRAVTLPTSAQRLLAYLALDRRWAPRAATAGTLWPAADTARASGNLRSALWRLTRGVGRVVVIVHAHRLRLDDDVVVDLGRAEHLAQHCDEQADPAEWMPEPDLFTADLLPDWDDDWLAVHREYFRQLRLRALEALCARQRRAGQLRQALYVALTAVSADPLRESAHRQLVQVHLAEGNVAEAVRQYEFYRHLLGNELGLVPSPVMRSLVAPLLSCPARPV
jgi:DNA-binding SARP family transcriptional activator